MPLRGNTNHDPIQRAVRAEHVAFRDNAALKAHLAGHKGLEVQDIGASREGQTLLGIQLGAGLRHVSVIAGCHADEPIGPMTAQALPSILQESFPELLESHMFHVIPQMNPDGADRNRAWFSDPLHLGRYLEHVHRELPGDDIEFGFADAERTRPENRAAMAFLAEDAPYVAHYSLHGMAWAEGAWCLVNREWRDRAEPFMDAFAAYCDDASLPLHDVDRHGEKGFERIREGFCTTPRSDAMREFFLQGDDPETAAKFQPNSMEYVMSLGGDPLCIVSELPLFLIGKRSSSLDEPISNELKDALQRWRVATGEDPGIGLERIASDFRLEPMNILEQMRAQLAMIVLSLQSIAVK